MTWKEWEQAKREADQHMKAANGHSYITILKTRCQVCGRSPRDTRRCGHWFQTFMNELDVIISGKLTAPDGPTP